MDENNSDTGLRVLPDHWQAPFLHAGFWLRVVAYIIDCLVLAPLFVVLDLAWIVPTVASSAGHLQHVTFDVGAFVVFYVLVIVVPWLYYAICESSKWQATPGKLAVGLRVTDEYGRCIGFGRATGRFFGKVVSGMIFDVGYMLAGWTARKQALHDLMAGCCVVRKDGLAMFERDESADTTAARPTGMPGWAIGLIVAGVALFCAVPVLAILAAIAIPAYEDYTIRAEVAEGVTLSHDARVAVTRYMARHGALPDSNADLGLASPGTIHGKYVSSVAVQRGQVVVTYGNLADKEIRDDHLVLVPQGGLSALHWKCRSPDIKVEYLPSQCRR